MKQDKLFGKLLIIIRFIIVENEKFSVGIAGYGVVGKRRRQFIDQHPKLRTIAVCDQNFSEVVTFLMGLDASILSSVIRRTS